MNDIELESEDLQAALEELHQYVDITEEDLKKISLKLIITLVM